jgi:type I restriction enzyme S subunit
MMIFRVAAPNDSRFVMWMLNAGSTYNQVKTDTIGATAPRINIPTISDAWIALPPKNEQSRIADHLHRALAASDRIVTAIREHIGRVHEYRQALITAAVTGKIDVTAEPK